MPLNVRRFCSATFFSLSLVGLLWAQTVPTAPAINASIAGPTSGDVMRERISKAKAFIAVRNYNAAIYELENIRRETSDTAVHAVVNVLLMNSYLEQGDFKRAQDFLTEYHNLQKTSRPNSSVFYTAIAGQVVKGAKGRVERYRNLGLSFTDKTLPLEALNDLEKMRETLELVITHSKEIGKTPAKTAEAIVLLEEASNSRSILGRDDYDARRWRDQVADARDEITNSRSVVTSALGDAQTVNVPTGQVVPPLAVGSARAAPSPTENTIVVAGGEPAVKKVDVVPAPIVEQKKVESPTVDIAKTAAAGPPPVAGVPADSPAATSGPVAVGSLKEYATKQSSPTYPPIARTTRTTGVVKLDITVDEQGGVADVTKVSGPTLLQAAAKDAIRRWKFKPFVRGGLPVRATGFVSFNFNL